MGFGKRHACGVYQFDDLQFYFKVEPK